MNSISIYLYIIFLLFNFGSNYIYISIIRRFYFFTQELECFLLVRFPAYILRSHTNPLEIICGMESLRIYCLGGFSQKLPIYKRAICPTTIFEALGSIVQAFNYK
jgi:hypothetical protein